MPNSKLKIQNYIEPKLLSVLICDNLCPNQLVTLTIHSYILQKDNAKISDLISQVMNL
jgi:hypothetical protein